MSVEEKLREAEGILAQWEQAPIHIQNTPVWPQSMFIKLLEVVREMAQLQERHDAQISTQQLLHGMIQGLGKRVEKLEERIARLEEGQEKERRDV